MGSPYAWRRSSACDTNACVEVRFHRKLGLVQVRDSEEPAHTIIFTKATWDAFVAGIKAGDFDE